VKTWGVLYHPFVKLSEEKKSRKGMGVSRIKQHQAMARILVVEDERIVAWTIQESLENAGHTVVATLQTGGDALAVAEEVKPDLVLMDIHLQGELDGIAVADHLWRQLGIPVVYLTAHVDGATLQRAMRTEPYGYLVKPFQRTELHTTIEVALHRHRLEKELATTQHWLSTTFNSLGDGAIATDQAGHITLMNPVAEELTGWHQTEALGQAISQVLPLIDATTCEVLPSPLLQAIQQGQPIRLSEHCLLRMKNGDLRTIIETASPIKNDHNVVIGGVVVFQDVTQQHEIESALRLSEARYRSVVDTLKEVIFQTDAAGRWLFLNPAWTEITGFSRQESLGKNLLDFVLVDDRPYHLEQWLALLDRQRNYSRYEFRCLTHANTIRWLEMFAQLTLDESGQVRGISGTLNDITHRKAAEEALWRQAEQERLLRAIALRIHQSLELEEILTTTVTEIRQVLQSDRVLIFQLQPDGSGCVIVESVGAGWNSLLNYCLQDPCVTLQPCIDKYIRGYVQAIDDIETAPLSDCYRDLLAPFQVRATLVAPIMQGSHPWGLLSVQHCETARQWHPWEIDLLRQLATQLAIAIQQAELYQQVQGLNAQLEQQVQSRTTQLQVAYQFEATLKRITDKVRDSLDEDQILQTAVQELALAMGVQCCNAALYVLEEGTSTVYYEYTHSKATRQGRTSQMADFPELYNQLLDGLSFQFCSLIPHPLRGRAALLASPILDDQGVLGDLWLTHDSEYIFSEPDIRLVQQVANQCAIALRQSQLYQASQAQVKELERLNCLKDDFLNTVSHELRTPVASIKMAAQLLEMKLNRSGLLEDDQQMAHYLKILQQECDREISLINDLLDLSRLESEAEQLTMTTIQLQEWIPRLIDPFTIRLQRHQQHLHLDLPADLPAISSDLSLLGQILTELLNNACKYTPDGETVGVTATAIADWMQIQITNSGVEIPVAERSLIFDKFYRIPSADPYKHGGTGLGLALVKKRVEHLHGTIYLSADDGKTVFTITLPNHHSSDLDSLPSSIHRAPEQIESA